MMHEDVDVGLEQDPRRLWLDAVRVEGEEKEDGLLREPLLACDVGLRLAQVHLENLGRERLDEALGKGLVVLEVRGKLRGVAEAGLQSWRQLRAAHMRHTLLTEQRACSS